MDVGLAVVGVIAAIYELIAVKTDKVPTITSIVKAIPYAARVLIVVAAALATLDHFLTEVVL